VNSRYIEEQVMIDTATNPPLRVSTEGAAGPFILLPVSQVEEVTQLLKNHGIRHWVQESNISLNGGPFTTIIELGHGGDPKKVQALLDGIR
jgi:hypothetical protein